MITLAIALLILIGISLLLLEVLVLPGITVAGVGGLVLLGGGLFLSYRFFGYRLGNYTLLFSMAVFIVSIVLSLKAKTWDRLALHSEINGKVNTIEVEMFKVGDKGFAITKLGPMGKVKVNDNIVEAKSTGVYIEVNTEVEIVKVNESNIIVKPYNL